MVTTHDNGAVKKCRTHKTKYTKRCKLTDNKKAPAPLT